MTGLFSLPDDKSASITHDFVHTVDKFALINNREYNKNYEDEAYQQANC
jgi:hypothetical protein